MRLISSLVVAMLSLGAEPAVAAGEASVDVRAVGDSAFVSANAAFGVPPDGWVESHLRKLEALRSPDVNFLNLEGAVSRSCRTFYDKTFSFSVSPQALIQFGKWGFNLIGLANNHSQDCTDPPTGAESGRAQAVVRAAVPDVAMHGVAADADALAAPAIVTVRGVRIGMIAIKAWGGGIRDNMGNADNRHVLLRALRDADVDVRILSIHGGSEGTRRPHATIVELAREFVARYGGDVVFAHHPHVMQGMEMMQKPDGRAAVVFYSLGNHLHNGLSEKGDGLMARVSVTKDGLDPDSVMAYPLARANTDPGPIEPEALPAAIAILRASSTAVRVRGLPPGLKRLPFTLEPIDAPGPGVRLVTAPSPVTAGTQKAQGRQLQNRSPRTADASFRSAPAHPDRKPRAATRLPPARWIPPKNE